MNKKYNKNNEQNERVSKKFLQAKGQGQSKPRNDSKNYQ